MAQRGTLTAALVSISEWNMSAERLNHLEALVEAKRVRDEIAADPTNAITHEKLTQKNWKLRSNVASTL